MNYGKTYLDTEGNECNILQMVQREPEWVANKVQEGERAIERVKELTLELGLIKVSLEYKTRHLEQCEQALIERDS